jgi:hypothetical protein
MMEQFPMLRVFQVVWLDLSYVSVTVKKMCSLTGFRIGTLRILFLDFTEWAVWSLTHHLP